MAKKVYVGNLNYQTTEDTLRALFVEYPDDPTSWLVDDVYLFGPRLLVAPLFSEERTREVYLPPGTWIDYQTGLVYSGERFHRIEAGDVPLKDVVPPTDGPSVRVSIGSSLEDAERRLILATLEYTRGKKRSAARLLGVSVKTLYNRLKAYNLQTDDTPSEGADAD